MATLTSESLLRGDQSTEPMGGHRTFGEGIGLCVKSSQGQPPENLVLLKDLGVRWIRESEAWARVERTPGK